MNMHLVNIRNMYRAVETNHGFDVIIVVSSSRDQADFWQERLEAVRGWVIGRNTRVISEHEDWPGGAGQLLGTLYAWQKARARLDVDDVLAKGGTVAMYHTAGKGMRMAPLPAAEANNKSAIKLPRLVEVKGQKTPITVLEAVIFQTGIFAASRPGRLCVFWGDQVFIPSEPVDFDGRHHAEILGIRAEIPKDEETWKREWQSYGLILPGERGEVLQREKQTWEQLQEFIRKGVVKPNGDGRIILGKSLGCFSASYPLLDALLEESARELGEKQLKLDTDPHLWMPLTSEMHEFISAGGDITNWKRVNKFKARFLAQSQESLGLFGDKDVGANTLWWDYGQVRLYHQNFLKLLEASPEGECLREFYDLESFWVKQSARDGLDIEDSVIVNSRAKGKIKHSILIGVNADSVDISGSVIINSSLADVKAQHALIYDCIALNRMEVFQGEAVTDVFLPAHGKVRVRTDLWRDGKRDWKSIIPGNWYSFEQYSKLVGDQPIREYGAERTRWMTYYENRHKVREGLAILKHSFIKPDPNNLVEVVWGGDAIEKIKGLKPSGKRIGESWECSTHPQHPCMVPLKGGGKIPLSDLVNLMGEDAFGKHVAREFKGQFPILVKFLDAHEDLSVQVHPSDEKAAELGERDTGKAEAWLILDTQKDAVVYLGFKENVDPKEFEKALSSPDMNIADRYLNAIPVKAGDVLYNPAGAVHAVGKGVFLAEIQQSSGITYRVWDWNRVPKRPLHIPQAAAALNFKKTTRSDYELLPRRLNAHEERLIDSYYFTVDRVTMGAGGEASMATGGGFQVLTCIKGKAELADRDSKETLSQGESVLVPAALGKYRIIARQDSVILKSFVLQPRHIDPVIFQTYDVRAIADEYLTDRVCYYLGKAYGTFVRQHQNGQIPTVAVGGGVRLSTERIRRQVIKGILSTGVNVYDVGVTSTPELYFSIPYLAADGGVNLTASHNESEYNGLKQVIRTEDGFITSINAEQMLEIKRIAVEGDFLEGEGKCTRVEEGEMARYHNELVKANCRLGREIWVYLIEKWGSVGLKPLLDMTAALDFPDGLDSTAWARIRQTLDLPSEFAQPETAIKHPFAGLKVVIDFGNGSAWRTKSVYGDLGAEVVALNEKPDGSFPAHIPDPIKAKYRKELEEGVTREARLTTKEVVGIGNDEDADRVIYVRSDGRVVEGDRTLAIQAKSIIEDHMRRGKPGKPRFMGEVKFSRIAEEYVTANGGEYIMSPTGFAFIKDGTRALSRALRSRADEVELFGRKIDLRENREPIALAAELSGHQMSGHEENWIFDDGLLAATKVLAVVAKGLKEGKTFVDIDEAVPRYPATPELNIRLGTNVLAEKQELVEAVVNRFRKKGFTIDTTDGGLIKWFDPKGQWLGQALVRKSNTQPMVICRVEGKDEESKRTIEDEFFGELAKVSTRAIPKLDLASDEYVRGLLPRVLNSPGG